MSTQENELSTMRGQVIGHAAHIPEPFATDGKVKYSDLVNSQVTLMLPSEERNTTEVFTAIGESARQLFPYLVKGELTKAPVLGGVNLSKPPKVIITYDRKDDPRPHSHIITSVRVINRSGGATLLTSKTTK